MAGRGCRQRRPPPPAVLCLAALLAAAFAPCAAQVTTADYQALGQGVGTLDTSAIYGSRLLLYGNAMAIAADGPNTIVAATVHGSGRAVHFGHEGMFGQCCGSTGLPRLLANAAAWTAGAKTSGVRVAGSTAWAVTNLVARLVAANPSKYVSAGTVAPASLSNLAVDLYIGDGYQTALGEAAANVWQFISNGGGLVSGAHAWYWSYTKDVAQHPSNLLLAPLGIYVSADIAFVGPTLSATTPPVQAAHADTATGCLEASCTGATGSACYYTSDDDLTAGMQSLRTFAAFVPAGTDFWSTLDRWEAASTGGIDSATGIPRRSTAGLAAVARAVRSQVRPPAELTDAPDAAFFPGKPAAGIQPIASPVTRTVNGTTSAQYWQCLGVWAMAGQPVTVTVPSGVSAASGARLRIGGWTDWTYHKTKWYRLPEMSRWYSVNGTATTIGSATGGLVYLELPSGLSLGTVSVQVSGAILAPYYLHGSTFASTWTQVLQYPAPWGEIGSSKLAIATPTSSLQTVTDPSAVMTYWDKALDAAAWMAGISTVRPKPERFQPDVDISAGYMHAGYPIMTFMDVVNTTLDPSSASKWLIEDTGLGFNLLKATIASYKTLATQPDGDDAELQIWVVQQSKTANRNLAAYYKAWGWPVPPPPSPSPPRPSPPPPRPLGAPTAMTTADYQALAQGVGAMGTQAWYSSRLYLFGGAMAVATDTSNRPFISATRHYGGRLVHFGHKGMVQHLTPTNCCNSTGLPRLLTNAAAWAAGSKASGIRLAGSGSFATGSIIPGLVARDSARFVSAGTIAMSDVSVDRADIVNGQDSGVGTNAAGLRQFLAEGGGILMGAQAWYWNYSKPLPDHPSNQLLTPLGIVLSGQYLTPPTTLAPTAPPSQLGNADVALACLNASCAGDTGSACYSTTSGTISGYTATCAWTDDYIPEGAAFWTTLQKWADSSTQASSTLKACTDLRAAPPASPSPHTSPTAPSLTHTTLSIVASASPYPPPTSCPSAVAAASKAAFATPASPTPAVTQTTLSSTTPASPYPPPTSCPSAVAAASKAAFATPASPTPAVTQTTLSSTTPASPYPPPLSRPSAVAAASKAAFATPASPTPFIPPAAPTVSSATPTFSSP
ncbi:hypothetical protein C2E20_1400 isoform X1 [Micractinium conductrix]|uniref:Peptidase M60 domain-containing protein n=1 Tax=Micractinium conductrix TaxID=554055 RepID=A0A2P6VMS9_9CHLO|nr:hypothetical protein C2E20_1400 isoform X1 [Micractinium conductrix]|eukprot:PSC75411.1 hypothetical protein C2E20_1400 isoform X1 [Micractinium conductrix]